MVTLRRLPPGLEPLCHVVLLHGLGGSSETWESKTAFWPAWLAEDVPAQVWLLDYPASPTQWSGTSMSLRDRAVSVLAALDPALADSLPVVLIGHSLGGLLIKQMMKHSVIMGDQFALFADRVAAVVFIASPHTGTGIADFVTRLGKVTRPTELVYELRHAEPGLRENDDWFRNYVPTHQLPVLSFYETRAYKRRVIVDQVSGDPHLSGVTAIPLDANHIQAPKMRAKTDTAFKQILAFAQQAIATASTASGTTYTSHSGQVSIIGETDPRQLIASWRTHMRSDLDTEIVEPLLRAEQIQHRSASIEGNPTASELALQRAARSLIQNGLDRLQQGSTAAPTDVARPVNLIPLRPINATTSPDEIATAAYESALGTGGKRLAIDIHQAVSELVANVAEHAGGDGYVAVSADWTSTQISVLVGDHGVGLLTSLKVRGAENDKEAILFAGENGSAEFDSSRGAGLPWVISTALKVGGSFYLGSGNWGITYARNGRQHKKFIGLQRISGTVAKFTVPLSFYSEAPDSNKRCSVDPSPKQRTVRLSMPTLAGSGSQAERLISDLGRLSDTIVVIDAHELQSGAVSFVFTFFYALRNAGAEDIRVISAPKHFADHLRNAALRSGYNGRLEFVG